MADTAYHLRELSKQSRDAEFAGVLSAHGFPQAEAVLDIGSGMGQTLRLLGSGTGRRVGIDIDERCLQAGLKAASATNFPIQFACSRAETLPFGANTFSHLMCRVTLNYLRPETAIAEFARVLRPGGIAYLLVESAGFDLDLLRRARSMRQRLSRVYDFVHAWLYNLTGWRVRLGPYAVGRIWISERRLRQCLERVGFTLVSVRRTGKAKWPVRGLEVVARMKPLQACRPAHSAARNGSRSSAADSPSECKGHEDVAVQRVAPGLPAREGRSSEKGDF